MIESTFKMALNVVYLTDDAQLSMLKELLLSNNIRYTIIHMAIILNSKEDELKVKELLIHNDIPFLKP